MFYLRKPSFWILYVIPFTLTNTPIPSIVKYKNSYVSLLTSIKKLILACYIPLIWTWVLILWYISWTVKCLHDHMKLLGCRITHLDFPLHVQIIWCWGSWVPLLFPRYTIGVLNNEGFDCLTIKFICSRIITQGE
jgi:hypothetical protein